MEDRLSVRRISFLAATVSAVVALSVTAASAGECPSDKVGVDLRKPGPTASSNVTDTVLSAIDVSKTSVPLPAYQLRIRRLVVQPGGIVAWHSHADRPSNIYILKGEITEYRSTCSVPITHKAGQVVAEFGAGLQHWWRNNSKKPCVLTSSDLYTEKMKDPHQM